MSFKSNLINIVLVETSHPGNIGSAARAMKTMGLSKLSLVNPKDFPSGDANALSGNARDVLDNATIYSSLQEAIKQSTFIYATSARNRSINWPTVNPEKAAEQIIDQVTGDKEISIVFGREDRGLTNEELQLANFHLEIPANPEYPVLNIAMSVQIVAYELFKNINNTEDREWRDYPEINSEDLQRLIDHFVETSIKLDMIDPKNPSQIIARIKRMFSRLQPDSMEGNYLRGFLTAINKRLK
jgi:tRNA (cytidine32/uridine32-2'-O)-methyltransferase|tara:strand:+ start:1190 stop:1915 length:726 start_codon:yes stop_codon:yes gene_type:complete